MIISLIVAIADNDTIGHKGTLPWRQSADLIHFKKKTLHHPLIMGRKTFESIGKVLPERTTIVISSNPEYRAPGCIVVNTLDEALAQAGMTGADEVFICGGASIYKKALPLADKVYLTEIHARPEGDTVFRLDRMGWQVTHRSHYHADAKNQYDYSFVTLKRATQ